MNLTALIAELFVGGVLCAVWLLLLFGAFIDISPLLAFAKDNALGGTVLFSVFAYALGVVFDRVWDDVLKRFDDKIEKGEFPDKETLRQARQRVFGSAGDGAEFVNYIRSRMRIARAVFCNGLFIGLSGAIFYLLRSAEPHWAVVVAIFVATIFISTVSFFALRRLTATYYKALKIFTGEQKPPKLSPETTSAVVTPAEVPPLRQP
jgi:hypothetical protein